MAHILLALALPLVLLGGCSSPSDETVPQQPSTNAQVGDVRPVQIPDKPAAAPAEPAVQPAAQPRPAAAQPRLTVDPEGLRWFLPPNGSARPLPFGTAQADLMSSLERVRGEAGEGTNEDCGAGPVQYANWADGLSLLFQNGRFAGWGLDGRSRGGITTADGIGIGTTRSQLDDAIGAPLQVRQTSLGTEFTAGSYHGLFDGPGDNARITDMWAGVSCVAR